MTNVYKFVPILFTVLLLTGKAQVQEVEHAPTIERCRADQRVWLGKLEGASGTMTEDFRTLSAWSQEMHDCQKVDPENHRAYYDVMEETSAEEASRLLAFLVRHGLTNKFIEEDKAGKR